MAYNQRPQFLQPSLQGSPRYQNHTFSHSLLDLLGCWTVLRHGESQIILYANSQVHLSPETINGLLAAKVVENVSKKSFRKFEMDSKDFCYITENAIFPSISSGIDLLVFLALK